MKKSSHFFDQWQPINIPWKLPINEYHYIDIIYSFSPKTLILVVIETYPTGLTRLSLDALSFCVCLFLVFTCSTLSGWRKFLSMVTSDDVSSLGQFIEGATDIELDKNRPFNSLKSIYLQSTHPKSYDSKTFSRFQNGKFPLVNWKCQRPFSNYNKMEIKHM